MGSETNKIDDLADEAPRCSNQTYANRSVLLSSDIIKHGSPLFAGTLVINTKCKTIWHMCPIGGSAVVVCGEQYNCRKLIHYNVRNGAELDSTYIYKTPDGLEEVQMAGKPCVAVSYV